MTSQRVTVSLPADVLVDARHAVADGAADTLSAFVADALRTQLSRARALARSLTRFSGHGWCADHAAVAAGL